MTIADRIRSESAIADRPGQMDRLEQIAAEVVESPAAAVRAFHEKFNFPIDRGLKGLRGALLAEEYREYTEAEEADDLVAIADALGDMVYVIYGTALTYGIPLDAVIAEIHRSNMTKETHPSGKAFKGAEYDPPRLAHVLAEQESPAAKPPHCHWCAPDDWAVEERSSLETK